MDNLESEHLDNGNGLVVPLPDLNANVTVDVINRSFPVVRTEIDGIIVPKKSKKNLRSKCHLHNLVATDFLEVFPFLY